MRKGLAFLLAALLSVLPAYGAVQLPEDQPADPACGLVSVQSTNLRVEEQWLTYRVEENFTGDQARRTAEVTSTWRLYNPHYVAPIHQEFLLPVLTTLAGYDRDVTSLTLDGKRLSPTVTLLSPYEVDAQSPLESLGLETLLTGGELTADLGTMSPYGPLYTLFTTAQTSPYTVNVTFRLTSEGAICLAEGFTEYSQGPDGTVTLTYEAQGEQENNPTFLLLGGEPQDLSFTAYRRQSDGREQLLDQSVASLSQKEGSAENFLAAQVQRAMSQAAQEGATGMTGQISEIAREMALREMARRQQLGVWMIPVDQLLAHCFNGPSLAVLQWDLEIRAGEEQMLGATFRATSGVKNQQYIRPSYPFSFYLNPAHGWAFYGPVHMVVESAQDAPHLINSNMDLDQRSNNYATTLPYPKDGTLTFSLSSQAPLVRFLRTSPLVVIAILAFLWLLALSVYWRVRTITHSYPH